jgi:hypothetical protein
VWVRCCGGQVLAVLSQQPYSGSAPLGTHFPADPTPACSVYLPTPQRDLATICDRTAPIHPTPLAKSKRATMARRSALLLLLGLLYVSHASARGAGHDSAARQLPWRGAHRSCACTGPRSAQQHRQGQDQGLQHLPDVPLDHGDRGRLRQRPCHHAGAGGSDPGQHAPAWLPTAAADRGRRRRRRPQVDFAETRVCNLAKNPAEVGAAPGAPAGVGARSGLNPSAPGLRSARSSPRPTCPRWWTG